MNVNETAILKKLVNGEREPTTHTKHATEKIRPWTQVRDLAQKFRRMSLFLQRITVIGATDNNRSTSTKPLDFCVIAQRIFLRDDLKIAHRRAVIQLDK